MPEQTIVAVVGPTAVGKSALALRLARELDGEIVSADSRQVYRQMDIGTGKPSPLDRAEVPHHLLDLADPTEEFTVSAFQAVAREALSGMEDRGARAVLVGGTGLHVRAVVDDLEIPGQYDEVRAGLDAAPDTDGLYARLADLDPEHVRVVTATVLIKGERLGWNRE